MLVNPHVAANCLKLSEENCGPLSLLKARGQPHLEKMDLKCPITVADVVEVSLAISM